MTEIEETLSRVLTAEADRHEPPRFDAYRIAVAATAKRRRWRPALFALTIAVIGTGGVGGATVFANGGGHQSQHLDPHPVPHPAAATQAVVIFQSRPGFAVTQVTEASALAWVRERAEVDGMKNVWSTVWPDPWRLEVAVPVADQDWANRLSTPVTLEFRPVAAAGQRAPAALTFHRQSYLQLRQLPKSSHGQRGPVWAATFTFDDAGTKDFAAFTTRNAGKPVEVLIDGAPTDLFFPQTVTDGTFELTAGTTQAQLTALGDTLAHSIPEVLKDATVTVSTR